MTRTNAYSLLCMIIRAAAVWGAANLLIALPGMALALLESPDAGDFWVWYMAAALVSVLVIAALWLFADKLARLALVRPQDQAFESSIEPRVWLGLFISAIGAWFLFGAVVDAVQLLARWLIVSGVEDVSVRTDATGRLMAHVAGTIAKSTLGLVLVLQGPGLSRWVHRMRYGVEPPPSAPGPM